MKDITGEDMIKIITTLGGNNTIIIDNLRMLCKDGFGYYMKYRKVRGKMLVIKIKFDQKTVTRDRVEVDINGFDPEAMFTEFTN